MKIFIDSGHNYSGGDTGATGNELNEQDITYQIAQKVGDKLKSKGVDVKYSRNTKVENLGSTLNESLNQRVYMANAWQANIFISIHCNANPDKSAHGTETYCFKYGGEAEKIAISVNKQMADTGLTNRGVKEGNFAVLRDTSMPAILVETAFITNVSDAQILANKQDELANAITDGILKYLGIDTTKEVDKVNKNILPQTVMKLDNIFVQVIETYDNFRIKQVDKTKRDIGEVNYFNLGYFAQGKNTTIPVGNLVIDGKVMTQTKGQAAWLNTSEKLQTTLIVKNDNSVNFEKVDNFDGRTDVKYAISGIPVIRNGMKVNMNAIKAEGYFGSELYDTWHGFLGIRHGKLVYVAFKQGFDMMPYVLDSLGIQDAIKVDGGGSFILVNGNRELMATEDKRKINNVGIWGK